LGVEINFHVAQFFSPEIDHVDAGKKGEFLKPEKKQKTINDE